jgi:hypothetical protein
LVFGFLIGIGAAAFAVLVALTLHLMDTRPREVRLLAETGMPLRGQSGEVAVVSAGWRWRREMRPVGNDGGLVPIPEQQRAPDVNDVIPTLEDAVQIGDAWRIGLFLPSRDREKIMPKIVATLTLAALTLAIISLPTINAAAQGGTDRYHYNSQGQQKYDNK